MGGVRRAIGPGAVEHVAAAHRWEIDCQCLLFGVVQKKKMRGSFQEGIDCPRAAAAVRPAMTGKNRSRASGFWRVLEGRRCARSSRSNIPSAVERPENNRVWVFLCCFFASPVTRCPRHICQHTTSPPVPPTPHPPSPRGTAPGHSGGRWEYSR